MLIGEAQDYDTSVTGVPRTARRAIAMTLATMAHNRFTGTGEDGRLIFKAIFAITRQLAAIRLFTMTQRVARSMQPHSTRCLPKELNG